VPDAPSTLSQARRDCVVAITSYDVINGDYYGESEEYAYLLVFSLKAAPGPMLVIKRIGNGTADVAARPLYFSLDHVASSCGHIKAEFVSLRMDEHENFVVAQGVDSSRVVVDSAVRYRTKEGEFQKAPELITKIAVTGGGRRTDSIVLSQTFRFQLASIADSQDCLGHLAELARAFCTPVLGVRSDDLGQCTAGIAGESYKDVVTLRESHGQRQAKSAESISGTCVGRPINW
jgi:hypothetical protein